jgi:hypothetical protein
MVRRMSTGKAEEREFLAFMSRKGKNAHVTRLLDASDIRGLTGGTTSTLHRCPSDFIVTERDLTPPMAYAEVKSTIDAAVFKFSLLSKFQMQSARQVLAAGGEYRVYVKALSHNLWFRVPFSVIQDHSSLGYGSISWIALQQAGHRIL